MVLGSGCENGWQTGKSLCERVSDNGHHYHYAL